MKSISRRSFLKGAAASAVSVAAASLLGGASLAESGAIYTPGTYSAKAQGIGDVIVTMTFDETSIIDVVLDVSNDTPDIGQAAAETLKAMLIEGQTSEIDAVAVSAAEVSTYVADGQLKTLVILGSNRCSAEALKDVPTASELGYDISVEGWGGFAVPASTDEAIVAKLVELSATAINSDDMKELLASKGYEHSYKDGAETDAYAKAQLDYYGELVPTLELQ